MQTLIRFSALFCLFVAVSIQNDLIASGAEPPSQQQLQSYGKLPLSFEANQGQTDPKVKFMSRGKGYHLYLTDDEAVLRLTKETAKSGNETALRMKLVGANSHPKISGKEELPGKVNYFIGKDPFKWRNNISIYGKVQYENVYPGIGLIYYGNQRQLEYDFVVAPGADPKKIALAFEGADRISIDPNGNLVLKVNGTEVQFLKPVLYQEVDGTRREVSGRYLLKGKNQVGFQVAAYDRSRPLIIDPVLSYSTYLGGSASDWGNGIAVDSAGNAFVIGYTGSIDFPVTAGAFQPISHGSDDVFIAKLNPTGSALIYATYLGGSDSDRGMKIAIDPSGNAYIAGETRSVDFPVTPGAFQSVMKEEGDIFITRLNSSGNALLYSTYLGGNSFDRLGGIAVNASGNAYVAGETGSTDFPTTPGAFQTAYSGSTDAFVTKLNSAGSALIYSTYLGGHGSNFVSGADEAHAIAIDPSGNAYITGATESPDFPTVNPFQSQLDLSSCGTHVRCMDVFVTKLNAAGSALVYSTYLGGSNEEGGQGIAVDASGSASITGYTISGNFPTANPIQPNLAPGGCGGENTARNCMDAFVTKLSPEGNALLFSTYLGGDGEDRGEGLSLDSAGNLYVTGSTDSTDFPILFPVQAVKGGAYCQRSSGFHECPDDAFVTKMNSAGNKMLYSTYLGGDLDDGAAAIAVDGSGEAYLTGATGSANFPVTPGSLQESYRSGFSDAFVAKIANRRPAAAFSANPVSGKVPLTVHFDGSASSDPDGALTDYAWTFGDGASASGPTVDHTYSTAGDFTATLTVTDDGGGTGSARETIAANPSGGGSALFSDNFNRSSGLGPDWKVYAGSWSTDGQNAVSTSSITYAGATRSLGTNDYTVEGVVILPAGATHTGVIARGNPAALTQDLYAALLYTNGSVQLFRRNAFTWTMLKSVSAAIAAGQSYTLALKVSGSNPVNLQVLLNGSSLFTFADSSSSRILSGIPGMIASANGVKYDRFAVLGGASAVNQPPTARIAATPPSGAAPLTVHFDGSGSSDSDGTINTYAWSFGDGTGGTGAAIDHLYSAAGTYTAALTVTDNQGAVGTASTKITVNSQGSSSSADNFDRPNSTNLGPNWSELLPDLEIFSNQLRNVDTGTKAAVWNQPVGVDHEVSVDCKVTAVDNNCALMARWSNADNFYRVRLDVGRGNLVVLKTVNGVSTVLGSASRPLLYDTYYRMKFVARGSSLTVYFGSETAPIISVTDTSLGGTYAGIRSSATAPGTNWFDNFEVRSLSASPPANQSPQAKIKTDVTSGPAPLKVHFDGSTSSDPDGSIVSYAWNFGDGTSGSGSIVDHTYNQAGTYTATLTVTDNNGATGSAQVTITVNNPASSVLFDDQFNRTTGLGSNWSVPVGSFTTDGNYAIGQGAQNWASVVPSLGTNDYTVESVLTVPGGSLYSGIVARGKTSADFYNDLYSAQISTQGSVNLYRRNAGTWTLLKSASAAVAAGQPYTLKLKVSGSNPVNLEVSLNGSLLISFADSAASRILSGIPGIENYNTGIKYDRFTVTGP